VSACEQLKLLIEDQPPKVEIVDERTIKYSWDRPNPRQTPSLSLPAAQANL
jgi:peptide/nickel transport system substrate-binding protein